MDMIRTAPLFFKRDELLAGVIFPPPLTEKHHLESFYNFYELTKVYEIFAGLAKMVKYSNMK